MNLEKIRKIVKLLSSPQDGDVVAAARALLRTLEADGADIHELADAIGNGKLSERDMQRIYDAAYSDGKRAAENDRPAQFHDLTPWAEMARECLGSHTADPWLQPRELEFVEDMTRWCERRGPTEKQGKWLHMLWARARRR